MAGEINSLAFCWRIERRDGAGLALTSHDSDVIRDGIRFSSDPGVVPSAVARGLGLEPHSGEVSGALSSEAISESDLALGKWDGAAVSLLAIDWNSPDSEPIPLLAGELGDVAMDGRSFTADLRGAAWRLNEPVCPSTSPHCRAQLGDKRCRVDLAGKSFRARIVSTNATDLVLDRAVDERYAFGRLRYLSGENCGLATVVLTAAGSTVRVRDLPRGAIETGATVEVREGCDKRFETCVSRFDNAVNFRGEPHLPGNDLLTRYPGA